KNCTTSAPSAWAAARGSSWWTCEPISTGPSLGGPDDTSSGEQARVCSPSDAATLEMAKDPGDQFVRMLADVIDEHRDGGPPAFLQSRRLHAVVLPPLGVRTPLDA